MGLFACRLRGSPSGVLLIDRYAFWGRAYPSEVVIFVLAALAAVETTAPEPPAEFGARPTPAGRPRPIIVVLGFFEFNRYVGDPLPTRLKMAQNSVGEGVPHA